MIEIDSPKKLEAWLKGKPAKWSAAVALRIAMRIAPIVGNPAYFHNSRLLQNATLVTFRCLLLSWITIRISTHEKVFAANGAAALARSADAARAVGSVPDHAISVVDAAAAAGDAIGAAAYSDAKEASFLAVKTSYCAQDYEVADQYANLWSGVSLDCRYLYSLLNNKTKYQTPLYARQLWLADEIASFMQEWSIFNQTLGLLGQGFEIWRDWFQRRVDGEVTGFDLPPDADAEISNRLIAATNDWWERPPAEVNADIKAWLEELKPPPAEPDEADFTQNPRALIFGADADGRIGLAPDLAANRLLDDTDAQDRHAEVLREAQALQAASQHGQTQATDLDQPTLDFIAALGESLAKTKPSWLVARGEKLRRMRGQRQNGTSLAPPLSERQAKAIDALITALDIMVGLDPYLLSIRQASYDPDMPRGTGDPVAIRLVIDHALEIKVARADAHDALADAVANVPADAAPDDRRRLTLWADFKNFIQATGRFIWKHKGKVTFAGVTSAITLIQLNAETLKAVFVASPTMLEIIRWIEMIKLPS